GLDFSALWGLYAGFGSAAYPPHLLLAVVLYETQRGLHSPAVWYRDSTKPSLSAGSCTVSFPAVPAGINSVTASGRKCSVWSSRVFARPSLKVSPLLCGLLLTAPCWRPTPRGTSCSTKPSWRSAASCCSRQSPPTRPPVRLGCPARQATSRHQRPPTRPPRPGHRRAGWPRQYAVGTDRRDVTSRPETRWPAGKAVTGTNAPPSGLLRSGS